MRVCVKGCVSLGKKRIQKQKLRSVELSKLGRLLVVVRDRISKPIVDVYSGRGRGHEDNRAVGVRFSSRLSVCGITSGWENASDACERCAVPRKRRSH